MSSERNYGVAVVTGAVAGAAAYLLGYLFTYVLTSGDLRESDLNQFIEAFEGDATIELVGWLFYNAHFVPAIVDIDLPFVGGTESINFIAGSEVFSPVLYLVPALLLVAAGIGVSRRFGPSGLGEAALVGATVVVGYLPLAIAGRYLFTVEVGSSSGSPDLVLAAGLAGLVYPVVCGVVGSVAARLTE